MMKIDYLGLYSSAFVNPDKLNQVRVVVEKIKQNETRYQNVAIEANIPWYVIATIHSLESDLNFNCHLHNGDPLSGLTTHVPRNRPFNGTPPFTWEESALDALTKSELWMPKRNLPWNIAQCLEFLERYNGLGYVAKGLNSPYLWSFTNLYTSGLFTSDHSFDPLAISNHIGVVALFKVMESKGYMP